MLIFLLFILIGATMLCDVLPTTAQDYLTSYGDGAFLLLFALIFINVSYKIIPRKFRKQIKATLRKRALDPMLSFLRIVLTTMVFMLALTFVLNRTLPSEANVELIRRSIVAATFAICFLIIWLLFRIEKSRFDRLVRKHNTPLLHRWLKANTTDEFGYLDTEKWDHSFLGFLRGCKFKPRHGSFQYYKKRAERFCQDIQNQPTPIPKDGMAFEHWCVHQLTLLDWKARITSNSADQGTDILAEKENFQLAIQCKRYSRPIGNKAVQEAKAGQQFYGADCAIVVGTPSYTKPAQALAAKLEVHLVVADDFSSWLSRFNHS